MIDLDVAHHHVMADSFLAQFDLVDGIIDCCQGAGYPLVAEIARDAVGPP